MIIAIDFDGVIVHNEYPNIGRPLNGMVSGMNFLANSGHTLIINTCRSGNYERDARCWLTQLDIPHHFVNQNATERIEQYGSDCRKISADVYIDDRNLGGFPGWDIVITKISQMIKMNRENDDEPKTRR